MDLGLHTATQSVHRTHQAHRLRLTTEPRIKYRCVTHTHIWEVLSMTALRGELTNTSWEESTYAERDGERRLTRAAVTQDVAGDITGTGQAEWLMSYAEDGTAHFVGLQQLEGRIDGREGSVVLETIGDFDGHEATWIAKVVDGSGTGEWTGMRGEGRFQAPHGPKASFTLDCSFD
jgi:hypothetical protein